MVMKNDEEFWQQTHTIEQAFRKIIHNSNTIAEFNKDTKRDTKYILDKLRLKKTDDVIELGCGLGRLLAPLVKHCNSINGVDVSGNIISLAEAYLGMLKNIEGVIQLSTMPNPFTIPINDEQYDKAYSFIVLQHMDKYLAFANVLELYRVLKPNGTVLLQYPDLRKQKQYFITHVNYRTQMTIPTARMYYYLEEELKILFGLTKFRNVEIWEEGVDLWVRAKK